MKLSVIIRGLQYNSDLFGMMAIVPMLPLYDGQPDEAPDKAEAYSTWLKTTDKGREWNSTLLSRFADPGMQANIAYCISAIFPDIPEAIASYTLLKEGNSQRIKFRMLLSLDEVMAFVQAIAPQIEEANKQEAIEPTAVATPAKADEIQAQIAVLQAQLPKPEGFASEMVSIPSVELR